MNVDAARIRSAALAAVGLSFVWPFFYWSFFLVSTFTSRGLYEVDPAVVGFLLAVAGVAAGLTAFSRPALALFRRVPAAAVVLSALSSASTIALHLGLTGAFSLPLPAEVALVALDACGLPLLLFLWAHALHGLRGLGLRGAVAVAAGSMLLFFVYALVFLTIVTPRCFLSLGAVVSACAWVAGDAGSPGTSHVDAQGETPADTPASPACRREPLLRLGPSLAVYALVSVVYWLLFASEEGGAVPPSSFSALGVSPLTQGHPAFYALLLAFFVALLALPVFAGGPRLLRALAQAGPLLMLLTALFALSLGYLLPAYVDVAEGLCCLVRAYVQFYIFALVVVRLVQGCPASLAFSVMWADAALILATSLLVGSGAVGTSALFDRLADISFAAGVAMLLAAVAEFVRVSRRLSSAGADPAAQEGFPACEPDAADMADMPAGQASGADVPAAQGSRRDGCDAGLQAACHALAASHGLSAREEEVLLFEARGYSAKRTAEELSIAASTVQTHISRIHTKLDVHSKQELIDLVVRTRA